MCAHFLPSWIPMYGQEIVLTIILSPTYLFACGSVKNRTLFVGTCSHFSPLFKITHCIQQTAKLMWHQQWCSVPLTPSHKDTFLWLYDCGSQSPIRTVSAASKTCFPMRQMEEKKSSMIKGGVGIYNHIYLSFSLSKYGITNPARAAEIQIKIRKDWSAVECLFKLGLVESFRKPGTQWGLLEKSN